MEKLKIGLLLDDYLVANHYYKMVEKIEDSHHSKISLVVLRNNSKSRKKKPFIKRLWQTRKKLLFILYSKLEDKLYRQTPDAFEKLDLKSIIECPEIRITPKETKFRDIFLPIDITQIKEHKIDVFIKIGFRVLSGEILKISKYGIWSYKHGSYQAKEGYPSSTREVLQKWDVTGIKLQILAENFDDSKIIFESFTTTDKISVLRNRQNLYWRALHFVPRALNQIFTVGENDFFKMLEENDYDPSFYYNPLFSYPSNYEVFKGVSRNYLLSIKRKIERLFYYEQWILLFEINPQEKISKSFYRFKRVVPPRDRIWADPFIWKKDNMYYVFLEEMLFSENKGKIAVMTIDEKGKYTVPKVIIEEDYHLSYPFVFKEQNELFMIPESKQNKTIDLYKCIEFPFKWEKTKTLINNIKAVDSTILYYKGKYWLFANCRENEETPIHDELFLFHTNDLLSGNWISHPQNPIVSDARYARPAGKIIKVNGRLYRPAQNAAKRYGYGMQIREIVVLSEDHYKERQVQSIYPNWAKDIIGTHTINHIGQLTVIDALSKRRKL